MSRHSPTLPEPSYMPPPLSPRLKTVRIAAMPIAGMAGMKKVTVTCAPAIGLPLLSVSLTRNVLSPLCGGEGTVVNSTLACVEGAFMAAAARAGWWRSERAEGSLKLAFGIDKKVRGSNDPFSGFEALLHNEIVPDACPQLNLSWFQISVSVIDERHLACA